MHELQGNAIKLTVIDGDNTKYVYGILQSVGTGTVMFTNVDAKTEAFDLANDFLCDNTVTSIEILTDPDLIQDIVTQTYQAMATRELSLMAKQVNAKFNEVIQYIPVEKIDLLEMLGDHIDELTP